MVMLVSEEGDGMFLEVVLVFMVHDCFYLGYGWMLVLCCW